MLVPEFPVELGRDGFGAGEAQISRHAVVVRHELDVDEDLLLVDAQLVDVHRDAGEVVHESLHALLQLFAGLRIVHAPGQAHLAPHDVNADVGDVGAPQEVPHQLADLRRGVGDLRDDPHSVQLLNVVDATERVDVENIPFRTSQ